MAWVATTSFETTDGSTTPTDGSSINGTGDGTGWSGNWSFIDFDETYYDNAVAYSGTWSAEQNTGADNSEPRLSRSVSSAVTSGTLSIAMRKNKTNRNNNGIYIYDGGTLAMGLYFAPKASGNGAIRCLESGGETTLETAGQAANTWYQFDIEFDCSTDTYIVKKDGVQIGGTINFFTAATSITNIVLLTGAASDGGSGTAGSITWFDLIENGASPIGPANLNSFDANAKANIKAINGNVIANIKTLSGNS